MTKKNTIEYLERLMKQIGKEDLPMLIKMSELTCLEKAIEIVKNTKEVGQGYHDVEEFYKD